MVQHVIDWLHFSRVQFRWKNLKCKGGRGRHGVVWKTKSHPSTGWELWTHNPDSVDNMDPHCNLGQRPHHLFLVLSLPRRSHGLLAIINIGQHTSTISWVASEGDFVTSPKILVPSIWMCDIVYLLWWQCWFSIFHVSVVNINSMGKCFFNQLWWKKIAYYPFYLQKSG